MTSSVKSLRGIWRSGPSLKRNKALPVWKQHLHTETGRNFDKLIVASDHITEQVEWLVDTIDEATARFYNDCEKLKQESPAFEILWDFMIRYIIV